MPSERVRRFRSGDEVDLVWGGNGPHTGIVLDAVEDPLSPPGYEHCSGVSAKYRLTGMEGWVYDWQLKKHKTNFIKWLFLSLLPYKS